MQDELSVMVCCAPAKPRKDWVWDVVFPEEADVTGGTRKEWLGSRKEWPWSRKEELLAGCELGLS